MPRLFFMILLAIPTCVGAATFTVTSVADSGAGSLREAVELANAAAGPDTIEFNIPNCPGSVCVIELSSSTTPVANISDPVIIDGCSQPGNSAQCTQAISSRGPYRIVLDGDGGGHALRLSAGSDGSVIRGLNVRNFLNGLALEDTIGSSIESNFIGTDENGENALPNSGNGVILVCAGMSNTVGGAEPGKANLISGNGGDGVQFYGGFPCGPGAPVAPKNSIVIGNLIGTARDGVTPMGNAYSGVSLFGAVAPDTFSGNLLSANVIGANSTGVFVAGPATGTRIEGNWIGTDVSASVDLGHDFDGVYFDNAINNTVGGINPEAGNIIAFNTFAGVSVDDYDGPANGITISRNRMFSNQDVGIDLLVDGPTSNDPGDSDTGPNGLQNTPVILSSSPAAASTLDVSFLVDSPGPVVVEFFLADPDQEEGMSYLASVSYSGAGTPTLVNIPDGGAGPADQLLATATDAAGSTSEFSAALPVPVQLQKFTIE